MILSDAKSHCWNPTKITNSGSKLYAWCKKPVAEGYNVETSHGSRIWFVVMTGRYDLIASGRAMMYLEVFFFEAILAIFRRKTMRYIGNRRRLIWSATICVSCNFFLIQHFFRVSFLVKRERPSSSPRRNEREAASECRNLLCNVFLVVYDSRCRILSYMSCFISDS